MENQDPGRPTRPEASDDRLSGPPNPQRYCGDHQNLDGLGRTVVLFRERPREPESAAGSRRWPDKGRVDDALVRRDVSSGLQTYVGELCGDDFRARRATRRKTYAGLRAG